VSIIGVLPGTYRRDARTELMLNPKKIMPEVFPNYTGDPLEQRGMHYLNAVARLKPGVSMESAQAEISGIAARLGTDQSGRHGVKLVPLHEYVSGGARPALSSCWSPWAGAADCVQQPGEPALWRVHQAGIERSRCARRWGPDAGGLRDNC
jgi:hypothetical protein